MASVFISYSRRDSEFARRLTEAFKQNELDFWIDWESIPPTVDWWKEIERGIEQADVYIFIISPDGVKSQANLTELEYAVQNGKRIIPIVAQEIRSDDAPRSITHLNWIFMREGDDFDEGLRKVVIAVQVDYEWVQFQQQLQIKALEWARKNRDKSYLLRGKALQEAEDQLLANSSREPKPTFLQQEYISASRKNLPILSRGVEAVSGVFGGGRSGQSQQAGQPVAKAANEAGTKPAEISMAGVGTIFISYVRKDKDYALRLTNDLKLAGFSVWIEQVELTPGLRWKEELQKGIQASRIFLVLLTPGYVMSEIPMQELRLALTWDKIILPILLEKFETRDMPDELAPYHFLDNRNKRYAEALASTKEALLKLAEAPPTTEPRLAQDSSLKGVYDTSEPQKGGETENVVPSSEAPAETEDERLLRRQAAIAANILAKNRAQAVYNDQAQGEDQLGIQDEVDALAETLLLRDVEPPVAVGIMGGWGSGKSFVMYLIGRHVQETRAREIAKGWPEGGNKKDLDLPAFVGHIYQVHFNAWTYAKSNLWASLMDTIFTCLNRQMQLERLFAYQGIAEAEELPAADVVHASLLGGGDIFKKIYRDDYQIDLDTDLGEEAKKNLNFWSEKLLSHNLLWQVMRNQNEAALQAMREDEQELEKYRARRAVLEQARQSESVTLTELDDRIAKPAYYALLQTTLLSFVSDSLSRTTREKLKESEIDPDELLKLQRETESLIKGSRGLVAAARQNRYYWLAGLSLAAAVFLLPYLWSWLGQPAINKAVAQLAALITAVLPFIPTFLTRWRKVLDYETETKKAFENALEAQRARQAEDIASENITYAEKVKKLEEEVRKGSLPACNVLIRLKENRIEQQRRKIGPAARYSNLLEFVQSRLDAATYENQLGLMHQVRQDIDELTYSLVSSANKDIFPRGKPRVLLYIDDLDRCPPQRVVEILEAVQLLLNTRLFVVILGLDTRYVTRALEKEYKEILQHEGDPSGLDYIEKIIQIPYRVRPIERDSLQKYLAMQMDIEKPPERRPDEQKPAQIPDESAFAALQPEQGEGTMQTTPDVDNQAEVGPVEPVSETSASVAEITNTPDAGEPASLLEKVEPEKAEGKIEEPKSEEVKPPEPDLPPAVIQFKQEDLADLTTCCQQISLTPRSIKRVVNVFKLMKIFWFRSDKQAGLADRDQKRPVKQAAICLLALSSAYPEVMREVFVYMEALYRHGQEHTRLFAALNNIKLPPGSAHDLAWQFQRYKQDIGMLKSMPSDGLLSLDQLTLAQLKFSTFNIVRSFSFVGDPVYWTDDEDDKSRTNGHAPMRRAVKLNRN